RDLSASKVVLDARKRCDQENLNAHLKNGVHALAMPLNTLHANWAYAVMAALAWSVKAWAALLLPGTGLSKREHREEKRRLMRMEFHTFRQALMSIPAQVVKTSRKFLVRFLSWNEWMPVHFRLAEALAVPCRC
ncbi:MAG: IS1380 family transposase, partial [Planctomycetota bacterium]